MASKRIIVIFALIVLFFTAAAFVNLYVKSNNFTWKMMRKNLRRRSLFRLWILIPTLLFVGLFAVLYRSSLRSTSSVVIALNYQEASKGQNANGTRYNMSEIVCDEVLERAIEKGALENVTAADLADCLSVSPTVQGDSLDPTNYHVSTEFMLRYESNKKLKKLDADTVVGLVADSYKEFFIEKYVDDLELLKFEINPETQFADMDYLDAADWLTMKASNISRYMSDLGAKNGSFTASNGETFASVYEKVQNLQSVQIEQNLRAYLLQNGISRDKDAYVSRLQYDNSLIDYDLQRARASFDIRNQAIQMYADEMTRIVLVPTWDEDGEYYMGRTKVGIDALSVDAEGYSKQASGYSNEIRTNNSTIASLENASGHGNVATVDSLIGEIGRQLTELAATGRSVGLEYQETRMNKCISSTIVPVHIWVTVAITAVFAVLFFLSLNLFVVSMELARAGRAAKQERRKG